MIRAFEYLTNLAVRCPLPNPLPRGEGIRFLKISGRRIGNQMEGKPDNDRTRQPNPLSPWERELGEGKQAEGLLLQYKIQPCPPNKSISESIFMQNQAKP